MAGLTEPLAEPAEASLVGRANSALAVDPQTGDPRPVTSGPVTRRPVTHFNDR